MIVDLETLRLARYSDPLANVSTADLVAELLNRDECAELTIDDGIALLALNAADLDDCNTYFVAGPNFDPAEDMDEIELDRGLKELCQDRLEVLHDYI